jgi:branched-chain amino acid transport system substrate-binding protein
LILYDDQVDPAKTAANIERLILRDNVHALLGSAGPEAVVAAGTVAEREGVPMITAQSPIRSFLRGRDQWRYVWDIFFDEQDMARQQFLTMNMVTSRKVALFTEHAPDGITMGSQSRLHEG